MAKLPKAFLVLGLLAHSGLTYASDQLSFCGRVIRGQNLGVLAQIMLPVLRGETRHLTAALHGTSLFAFRAALESGQLWLNDFGTEGKIYFFPIEGAAAERRRDLDQGQIITREEALSDARLFAATSQHDHEIQQALGTFGPSPLPKDQIIKISNLWADLIQSARIDREGNLQANVRKFEELVLLTGLKKAELKRFIRKEINFSGRARLWGSESSDLSGGVILGFSKDILSSGSYRIVDANYDADEFGWISNDPIRLEHITEVIPLDKSAADELESLARQLDPHSAP